jgi:hypothetical protein
MMVDIRPSVFSISRTDCRKCRFYTWGEQVPYDCTVVLIKSKRLPHLNALKLLGGYLMFILENDQELTFRAAGVE